MQFYNQLNPVPSPPEVNDVREPICPIKSHPPQSPLAAMIPTPLRRAPRAGGSAPEALDRHFVGRPPRFGGSHLVASTQAGGPLRPRLAGAGAAESTLIKVTLFVGRGTRSPPPRGLSLLEGYQSPGTVVSAPVLLITAATGVANIVAVAAVSRQPGHQPCLARPRSGPLLSGHQPGRAAAGLSLLAVALGALKPQPWIGCLSKLVVAILVLSTHRRHLAAPASRAVSRGSDPPRCQPQPPGPCRPCVPDCPDGPDALSA